MFHFCEYFSIKLSFIDMEVEIGEGFWTGEQWLDCALWFMVDYKQTEDIDLSR